MFFMKKVYIAVLENKLILKFMSETSIILILNVVFFATQLALILGLINPTIVIGWSKKPTRGRVFGYYCLVSIVFTIIFSDYIRYIIIFGGYK